MNTLLIRLGSVIKNGVGGPEAGLLDLIYSFLLQEYDLALYGYININQIGDKLQEVIIKRGKNIFINIRYPVIENFENKDETFKNQARLDVMHAALLRLSAYDMRLDKTKLVLIRERILQSNFSFDFIYRQISNRKNGETSAKLIIHPTIFEFIFYLDVYEGGERRCRVCLYKGKTTDFYFEDLFSNCKWKSSDKVIISGKRSEIDIIVFIEECYVEYQNKSKLKGNAPVFELFKADADDKKNLEDYIRSLNPAIATTLTQSQN